MPLPRSRMRLSRALPWLAGALLMFGLAWQFRTAPPPAPVSGSAPAAQTRDAGPATGLDAGAATAARAQAVRLPDFLPAEAAPVIDAIQRGARFPHRQDGSVFGNREKRLPLHPHGYYREYTVPTPGLSHRGARRIVTGGQPPRDWYYTADHYDSFRAFQPPAAGDRQ